MKIIIITFLLGLSFWLIPTIAIYAVRLDFLLRYLSTKLVTYCYWLILKKEKRMSDVEATDIYPLSVEEYESAEVVAEDVEVE